MKFFAFGLEPVGVIAIGGFARGGIAIGQGAVGVVAVGQLATGMFTLGQLSLGLGTIGQLALSPAYAFGQLALGGYHGGGLLGVSLRPGRDDPGWLLAVKAIVFIAILIVFWYAAVLPVADAFSTETSGPRPLK